MGRRALAAGVLILAGLALGVGFVLTPHDRVSQGCFWWTAKRAGDVLPGDRGCVRGYAVSGGSLGDGPEVGTYAVSYYDQQCGIHPGESVVARYHAIFDDGRTILIFEGCP
jgi:hypothetical protein